ncbi:aryl hydrocarbon receptor 2 [Pholidichthys leucotaenia]
MLPNTAMYAVKKRKKPVQKTPKPPPPDGAKSNPSKRHRDRLNGELDKLTSLLPFSEEVRARLDKLSVLRLSVGFLKVKNFFNATMKMGQNNSSWSSERSLMFGGNGQTKLTPSSSGSVIPTSSSSSSMMTSIDGVTFSEGDFLLRALNGFVLVVTAEGYVFYTSPTIQDFLGFHQSDVIHQSVFELIHTDDRALFRQQLHFSLNMTMDQTGNNGDQNTPETSSVNTYDPQSIPPENSSFLERNFCCRLRCLLDNSSGFLALNFRGHLKFLHGQNQVSEDGTLASPHLALFAIATPLQQPSILEIRTKTLFFQTKHKLDFRPTGIDARGTLVLGYSNEDISSKGSGYYFIHAADMMYCADNHIRMMKTGDSGATIFRLLAKNGSWIWVESHARVVFKGGKPDFVVAQERVLTNEEGEEQLRLRRLQLPFNVANGEDQLYDILPTVDVLADSCSAPKQRKTDSFSVSPDSMLGCMLSQDQSLYCEPNSANTFTSLNDLAFKDTYATVTIPRGSAVLKPTVGNLVKVDTTLDDMMESLQQIIGDSDLTEALNVELDELKGWESTLLRMNYNSCKFSDDLSDVLGNDILSFVEEQLQKEGGLKLDTQDGVPTCPSTLDFQNQDPDCRNVSWSNGGQMMAGPSAPNRLDHADFPQFDHAGLNGLTIPQPLQTPLTFSLSLPNPCPQPPVNNKDSNRGLFSIRQTPPGLFPPNQTIPPMQNLQMNVVNQPQQNTERQLNHIFKFQARQWPSPVSSKPPRCISDQSSFPPPPPSSSSLQGCFCLQTQSSDGQKLSWPPAQQREHMSARVNCVSGLQRNSGNVNGTPPFRNVQSNPEQPTPGSCMFRNAAPPQHLGQARFNPAVQQVPAKQSCFYQTLPAGGTVPGVVTAPDPDQGVLSCQMATGLLVPQQILPDFNEQTQMNSHPVVGNGGFPFPSLPVGNLRYSENK